MATGSALILLDLPGTSNRRNGAASSTVSSRRRPSITLRTASRCLSLVVCLSPSVSRCLSLVAISGRDDDGKSAAGSDSPQQQRAAEAVLSHEAMLLVRNLPSTPLHKLLLP